MAEGVDTKEKVQKSYLLRDPLEDTVNVTLDIGKLSMIKKGARISTEMHFKGFRNSSIALTSKLLEGSVINIADEKYCRVVPPTNTYPDSISIELIDKKKYEDAQTKKYTLDNLPLDKITKDRLGL